jgi:hypothetical protein
LEETVRVAIPQVLAEADEAARRFLQLREAPAPQPVDDYLRRLARDAEVPEAVTNRAMHALEGETLYDVVNALTNGAQALPVGERVRVETLMSQFLRHAAN